MSKITTLIVGSGGREHALAWKLAQSPQVEQVLVAPGNAGTAQIAENIPIPDTDLEGLLRLARQRRADLTVVGPEGALAAGIVDEFTAAGLRIFGPSQAAARLESSKAFAKQFMLAAGIPTAEAAVFSDYEAAQAYLKVQTSPVVIKASGLAAGKGVIVCNDEAEAQAALAQLMETRAFGAAADEVLIEERMHGPELSLLVFSDGRTAVPMIPARDYKRIFDHDQGPNTGGMGAFGPPPDVGQGLVERIMERIVQPTVLRMAAAGTPYVGVLYAGLMLTAAGPKVVEFNCRFGDPETQVVLPLLDGDLAEIMLACIDGRLTAEMVQPYPGSCAAVVMAAPGYPGSYRKGLSISGLADMPDGAVVFHAGTSYKAGQVVSSGGRVLAVSATGTELETAVSGAYAAVSQIHFEGAHYRRDIGRSLPGVVEETGSRYAAAGVDIAAGRRATRLMKTAVEATFGPEVLSDVGAFGGLFAAGTLKEMDQPVLVASTDGVGTKTKVAAALQRWDTLGHDIVNHCINDILVQGARPLFFLDYVASARLDPEQTAAIVQGIAQACQAAGCALLGGETAEMPGVYLEGEVDLVGTVVGIVERSAISDGARIAEGDMILGLPSRGLHTNGYTLARQVLSDLDWRVQNDTLGSSIGEALLQPHRCYLAEVRALQAAGVDIRGLSHITGGGLVDNPPRIFPEGLSAILYSEKWPVPPLFTLIQTQGGVSDAEMRQVFNMGLGMLLVVPPTDVSRAQETMPPAELMVVGKMVSGAFGVGFR